jgi:hypothetical protein
MARDIVGVLKEADIAPPSNVITTPSGSWFRHLGSGQQQTQALTDGTLYGVPLSLSQRVSITQVGIFVRTAGAASTVVSVGIYGVDSDGLPDGLLLDAGDLAGDSTGAKTNNVTYTFQPGSYWYGVLPIGGSPELEGMTKYLVGGYQTDVGQCIVANRSGIAATTTSLTELPDPFGAVAPDANAPLVAFKAA